MRNITVGNRPFAVKNVVMTVHFVLPEDKMAGQLPELFISINLTPINWRRTRGDVHTCTRGIRSARAGNGEQASG